MHVAKLVLVLLLASPALAAETTSADAALQKARRDLAAKLEHQVKSLSTRATRSARATAADAPAPFAADRRSLAEEDGYLMCDIMNYAVQCGTKLTQATCAAETDCSWVAGEGCGPSAQSHQQDRRGVDVGHFSPARAHFRVRDLHRDKLPRRHVRCLRRLVLDQRRLRRRRIRGRVDRGAHED
jgi:hypothetical protein